jgi:hypothetical protein
MNLKITDLSNDEHLAQLVYLRTNPDTLIEFVINNGLDAAPVATPAALAVLQKAQDQGLKFRDTPALLVEWYNAQFNTSFTVDQLPA